MHICFGSFRRLPYAKRTYRWLFPTLLDANVHGFSLEFGGREMAEIDLVGQWDRGPHPLRGPDRHQDALRRDPRRTSWSASTPACSTGTPTRLEISTDCGLRRVPRNLAMAKMTAAAEAARRVRGDG